MSVELASESLGFQDWVYGPGWPDPEFNWGSFDENENR